ncbi:MAG TPA: NapC/NirT family cytochrome c [Candidatus Aquicultor sp.]
MKSGSRRLLVIVGSVIVVVVALLVTAMFATSNPRFCNTCHEMNSGYNAWRVSFHSKVDCEACYLNPRPVNFVISKVQALSEVYYHFTNTYQKPINKDSQLSKTMPSSVCTPCHKPPARVTTKTLIFVHPQHLEEGLTCAYCHNRISHGVFNGYRT